MIPFYEDIPGDGQGGGGGTGGGTSGEPPHGALPGLASHLVPRYTSNVTINEIAQVIDVLHECIFLSSRMFLSQGANGKIRVHNKKPVTWGLGLDEFPSESDLLLFDDVSGWVDDISGFLLIDPHTTESELRTVIDADYSITQNSVTLTGSAILSIVGFAGCDGDSTPATATVTVGAFTPGSTYNLTLSGVQIEFIPGSSDSTASIASFLAATIRAHPRLTRLFRVEWNNANAFTLTGKFGTLTIDPALELDHVGPQIAPAVAPTLAGSAGGELLAGTYRVAYAWKNSHGRTLTSPSKAVTITVNQKIIVTAVTPPADCTVVWYVTPEAGSEKLRAHLENDGASFEINTLPNLNAPLPPDINRTGTEALRVRAAFSDREETRSQAPRSNVIRASFEWLLGTREKSVNRVDLKYRDSGQDWRLIELRVRDDEHISKTKKTSNLEVNGQAIDNYFQALRIAVGMLGEQRDADFFYQWTATREALLLEEGDVVAITDAGSGVINFPVWIESIELDAGSAGLPTAAFVGRKFANTLYDDSMVDLSIPVIPAPAPGVPAGTITYGGEVMSYEGEYITYVP